MGLGGRAWRLLDGIIKWERGSLIQFSAVPLTHCASSPCLSFLILHCRSFHLTTFLKDVPLAISYLINKWTCCAGGKPMDMGTVHLHKIKIWRPEIISVVGIFLQQNAISFSCFSCVPLNWHSGKCVMHAKLYNTQDMHSFYHWVGHMLRKNISAEHRGVVIFPLLIWGQWYKFAYLKWWLTKVLGFPIFNYAHALPPFISV